MLVGSNQGQLSRVIRAAGGPQIQQALRAQISSGHVTVTQGDGKLLGSHVIITHCRKWDMGNGVAEMVSSGQDAT